MGTEVLFLVALLVGASLLVWLVVRSLRASTRTYALPTLICASLVAVLGTISGTDAPLDFSALVTWFCYGAIVLGIHAHLIRFIAARSSRSVAP